MSSKTEEQSFAAENWRQMEFAVSMWFPPLHLALFERMRVMELTLLQRRAHAPDTETAGSCNAAANCGELLGAHTFANDFNTRFDSHERKFAWTKRKRSPNSTTSNNSTFCLRYTKNLQVIYVTETTQNRSLASQESHSLDLDHIYLSKNNSRSRIHFKLVSSEFWKRSTGSSYRYRCYPAL